MLTQLPDTYISKELQKTISDIVYSCRARENKQELKDRKLSPIIPILLYHGKERWQYRTLITLFKNLDQRLCNFIPDYDYIYRMTRLRH